MKVIGITGGVGCGKSAVMDFLEQEYDALVLKADSIGHLLMKPGQVCYEKMRAHFGDRILNEDRTVNRAEVARIIFSDPAELAFQNGLMHPAIRKYILEQIEAAAKQGRAYCFVEAALFLEDHYDDFCDEVWYIYTDVAVRRNRLKESRGYTDEKIDEIMAKQMTETEFKNRTAFTVDNSGSLEQTKEQIRERMHR